jgi:6-phosphogluconolactonase
MMPTADRRARAAFQPLQKPLKNFELIRFANDSELAHAVAEEWLKETEAANHSVAPYGVALSGGRIARKLFSSAAEQARASQPPLNSVHFFWADERCVPPDDAESNFRVARELLFRPLRISDEQIHRIQGEAPPAVAAAEAEAEICRIAPLNSSGQPLLNLILLGMGEDGHVASLFPGEPESVMANPAAYRVVTAAKPPPQRITMGYMAIAAAQQVWVLASGQGKEAALHESLGPTGQTPLARVLKSRPFTRIFAELQLG